MGQIGDFMQWFDAAVERTLQNNGTVIVQESTRKTRKESSGKKEHSECRTMVQRIIEILKREGDVPSTVIRERLRCSTGTVCYAKAKLRGANWVPKSEAYPPGLRRGPRYLTATKSTKKS